MKKQYKKYLKWYKNHRKEVLGEWFYGQLAQPESKL